MGSPGHLKFAGVQRSPTHILNISKPSKVLIDHIFRFSTSLALEWVSEQDCESCALVLVWTKVYLCEPTILGVLLTRRHVNDPPAWCGAASISFVRGTWRPLPWWRSSLVESGAKVIVIVFTEKIWWPRSNTLCECFNNVDIGLPLCLTEPRDKSSCHKSLHSLISF